MAPANFSVDCPSCGVKNSIKKKQILDLKESPACKVCNASLLPHVDAPFTDLSPSAFIHNLDRQMLEALKKIPGVDSVLRALLRHSVELAMRLHHQANFVKASKKQAKGLYTKLSYAASVLDIPELPELYVVQDARVNAYTFGVEKCSIAISAGALELLTDDEITYVLAHELGHIKAHHVLYKTASRLLLTLADSIAQKTFGLSGLVLYPIQVALLRWDRASELSSDRAGLLVVKNPMTVLSALMKLAGGSTVLQHELNIDAFIEQASRFEETQDEGPLGKYIAVMSSIFQTHPFPIWRAKEILNWVENGAYVKILRGDYQKLSRIGATCRVCGEETKGSSTMCPTCSAEEKPKPYTEHIDKAIGGLRSWYDRNFNASDDR